MQKVKSRNGIVHVLNPLGCGEYTFCGLEISEGGGDPLDRSVDFGEKRLVPTNEAANCQECKAAIDGLRKAVRGVRFSRNLRSPFSD